MSGLVLMYSRALKPADYVHAGDTEGVVVDLGLLSTKIRPNKRELSPSRTRCSSHGDEELLASDR